MTPFELGFHDMLKGEFGRTWPDDQDANEAYDRGGNAAEELMGNEVQNNHR